jgi:hypothetical protein
MDGIAPGLLQPVLENHDLPSQVEAEKVTSLLEVYVDDFIGLIRATDPDLVRHYSRALLHGIHSVSPPAPSFGHHSGDPISGKKMLAGDGVWAVRKEILGWMFDGITRTIELPPAKFEKPHHPTQVDYPVRLPLPGASSSTPHSQCQQDTASWLPSTNWPTPSRGPG